MIEKALPYAVMVAIVAFFFFLPNLRRAAEKRWPGVFETHNPIRDELPTSWMVTFVLGVIAIFIAGILIGAEAGVLTFFALIAFALIQIHVVPYVRHQWRRVRGRTQAPPTEC